jgi:hypothetical protein
VCGFEESENKLVDANWLFSTQAAFSAFFGPDRSKEKLTLLELARSPALLALMPH